MADANSSTWKWSVLAACGALLCTVTAVNSHSRMWTASTAIGTNTQAVASLNIPAHPVRTTTLAEQPPMLQAVASNDDMVLMPVEQTWAMPAAVVTVLGACAALWARFQKRNIMQSLDIEEGMPMVSTAGTTEVTYHFLVANARFLLYDEEHAMELMREKRRFLREKGLPIDFWIVPNPEFLDQFPDIDKRVLKPCCAVVTTDEKWLMFMKLRYDRVITGSFTGSTDVTKVLATKGGDPKAAVPKFTLPEGWDKNVPYPHYAEDWFHPFLVGASQ